MPDFDPSKSLTNGGIKGVFRDVIVVSISILIGYQWQGFIREVVEAFFPAGSGLVQKFFLNIILTVILVGIIILLNRRKT